MVRSLKRWQVAAQERETEGSLAPVGVGDSPKEEVVLEAGNLWRYNPYRGCMED
jgi:hypothetical protein